MHKDKEYNEDVKMVFVQTGGTTAGTDGIRFGCNGLGCYCNKRLSAEQSEARMLQWTHPEENLGFGDMVGQLEDGVPEE